MAPKPDRLVFVFGMVVAMAVTILAITTWAAPPSPESDSAASISPRQTIYRPERWNLYKGVGEQCPWQRRVGGAHPEHRNRLSSRGFAPQRCEHISAWIAVARPERRAS